MHASCFFHFSLLSRHEELQEEIQIDFDSDSGINGDATWFGARLEFANKFVAHCHLNITRSTAILFVHIGQNVFQQVSRQKVTIN